MPDTTSEGAPFSTVVMPMFTQSVGVPSTAYARSPNCSSRNGRRSVNEWPTALASCSRATTVTSPSAFSASASAFSPSERTPSSFVTRIRIIGELYAVLGAWRWHQDEQQNRGQQRKRCAGTERHRCAEDLPQPTKDDAR